MNRLHGLPPEAGPNTGVLVLGSFPGVASLQAAQYYGHPRNQFWTLVGAALGLPLAQSDYAARLQLLRQRGVGLWDVIAETAREGSLDSAIRQPRASDLRTLVAGLPRLHTVAFNGATAARLGLRALGDGAKPYRILMLPSSSPAYTLPVAEKLRAWAAINPAEASAE